ncbi:MAG: acyltransferase [Gammaproteobacteria bacterium]|nr:acyltransferase [Gammaproteobacteria bacterium]
MKKLRSYFLYLLGLPKTIYFNFKYLPFNKALSLPVFISHRVWLKKCAGKIELASYKMASVKIGYGGVSIFDENRSRSIWHVNGSVKFNGKATFGHGTKIDVSGVMDVGDNFEMTAESSIICHEKISFGNDVLISWDTLIMDCDFHKIYDERQQVINEDKPVVIGNKVWIGCRCLILKGVAIADGVIVAAASTVSKSIDSSSSIIAGSPAQKVKENISWSYD